LATPKQIILLASAASGILTSLATAAPSGFLGASGADNAIIRFDSGTARWSETFGSYLNASQGILISAADPPIRVSNLAAFAFVPVGGGAVLQALPYQGFFVL
jgi:hypothetical protein